MKAFIWDLDGTLLDSYEVIVGGLFAMCRKIEYPISKNAIHRFVIISSVKEFMDKVFKETGIDPDELERIYSGSYIPNLAQIRAIPEAKEALETLKKKDAVHFVFTHRGKSSEPVLKRLGLHEFFSEFVTGDMGFPRKPEPDAIFYLMKKYGLKPEDTYYVGDRTIDMDCAKNAGVRGVLYLPEGSYCKPNGSETYIVQDLRECAGILEG